KDRLVRGSFRDWAFQHVRGREIDGNAEEVGEMIFKSDHIKQGQVFGGIEFGNQINIGSWVLGTRHGPVQAQMNNAGSLELWLMLAQRGDDMLPVHTRLSHICF